MELIILDLDETLVYATEEPLEYAPNFVVGPYGVYIRPYLDEFLATVDELASVAVWTVD